MGDLNQLEYVREHRKRLRGPVLEVGSHDYGNTQPFRPLFADDDYVGTDAVEGEGVDVALDLTLPFAGVDEALGHRRFGTILCLSVLEHCRDPFAMARNITALLAPGGTLVISVPWTWEFHGYPSDYWRFTHEGVKVLFPDLDFPDQLARTSTNHGAGPIDEELGAIRLSTKDAQRQGRYGKVFWVCVFRVLRSLGLARWIFQHRYVMPPTMIEMIGVRADEPDA